jgi:3-oxoacyl-[acyl-carrier protein] reductase
MLSSNLLQGKVALVTGANRGIGRAIAKQFIYHGALVYANARTHDSLDGLISELSTDLRSNLKPVYFDITDSDAAKNVFLKIHKESKQLDCLVNNAGIMKDALIGMISRQLINELFTTNVYSTIELLQLAVKLMARQNSGSIVNISSMVGTNGNYGQMAYSASKGAVISLTKSAAKELAPKNIRVNAIAPGIIETDLLRNVDAQVMDSLKSRIGMKRIGTPDDVAGLATFLASDLSKYVTGQVIGVDGAALM